MGFLLTLLYVILSYLSPQELFPGIAPYRPMVFFAALAVIGSLPQLASSQMLFRARQTYLLLAFIIAIFLSNLVHGSFGAVLSSAQYFLSTSVIFFLVVLNVTTLRRLRLLIFAVVVTGLFLVSQALYAYYTEAGHTYNVCRECGEGSSYFSKENSSLFLLRGEIEAEGQVIDITRIRSVGTLHDPNDFAQYLLTMLPLLWLAWKSGSSLRNTALVVVPSTLLMLGIYFTHSRGAVLGFVVICLFALRRRMGNVGSTVATIVLLVALLGLNVTAHRQISLSEGAGRLDAWSEGLGMFKSSPLFGVGFRTFTEHYSNTAHNSFVLCLSELGLFGFFPWLAMLVISLMQLNDLVSPAKSTPEPPKMIHAPPKENKGPGWLQVQQTVQRVSAAGTNMVQDCAISIRLSLIGFLATSWFLSRTYVDTLYLLLGLVVAVTQITGSEGERSERPDPARKWVRTTAMGTVMVILAVYASVRLRSF